MLWPAARDRRPWAISTGWIPDLVSANQTSGDVSVLLGTGSGSFGQRRNYAAGSAPWYVSVGDFNVDGNLDWRWRTMVRATCRVAGNGNGQLRAATNYAAGGGPWSVAVGDLNGDGKRTGGGEQWFGQCVGVAGTGQGASGLRATTRWVGRQRRWWPAILNGDGNLDLAVAKQQRQPGCGAAQYLRVAGTGQCVCEQRRLRSGFCVDGCVLRLGCGGGLGTDCEACSAAMGAGVDGTCGAVASGRLCREASGACDLVETCDGSSVSCPEDGYLPLGSQPQVAVAHWSATEPGRVWRQRRRRVRQRYAVSDERGDRYTDADDTATDTATATVTATSSSVATSTPTLTHTAEFRAGVPRSAFRHRRCIRWEWSRARWRRTTLTGTAMSTWRGERVVASVSVLLGTGAGSFAASTDFAVGSGPSSVATGDFNGDGNTDVAVREPLRQQCVGAAGDGNGHLRGGDELRGGKLSQCGGVGDFDVDGNADLAVANWGSNTISIFWERGRAASGGGELCCGRPPKIGGSRRFQRGWIPGPGIGQPDFR